MSSTWDEGQRMIALAEAGDTEALGVLLKRYEAEMLRTANRINNTPAAGKVSPADIMQMSYENILRTLPIQVEEGKAPRWTTERDFTNWLKAVVKNRVKDAVRFMTTKGRDPSHEQGLDTPPDRRRGPATAVAERERTEGLKALIRKTLDPRQAAAVECDFFEGLTISEIQERLGCDSYDAAASLLRHGRANLRKKAPGQLESLFPTVYGESTVGSRVRWTGKVKSVTRSSSKITICIKEDNHTFTVPDDVKILLNGQSACLDEIEADFSVTLTANRAIARILDASSSWRGIVASTSEGQISLRLDTELHVFDVASDSRISQGGKPISLTELECGEEVTVTVKNGLAQAIEVTPLDLQ